MLYDPAAEKVLFEHNAGKYFTPASNIKILSFYTGLKLLKDSIPAINYGIVNDTLYFQGTGDPTFLHPEFSYSKVFDFLKSRSETLVLIPNEVSETAFGPGWAWEDYNYAFSAERADFPIFGNLVTFSVSEGSDLNISPFYFRSNVQIDSLKSSKRVQRAYLKNQFEIPLFDTSGFRQVVPFKYSSQLAAQLLSDTLKKEVLIKNKFPENISQKQKIYSIPVDSLYKPMLQQSDNFLAEQLLLVAAGEVTDTIQTQKAISYMLENHLNDLPDGIRWVDGSGLSRYNLLTPRSMVHLLTKINREVPRERLLQLFPAGGDSGTLEKDYIPPAGKPPYVYAKTGTLNNNHSLSGFLITSKGKFLIFSFMNSNYVVPTTVIKSRMEGVLRNIYLNY